MHRRQHNLSSAKVWCRCYVHKKDIRGSVLATPPPHPPPTHPGRRSSDRLPAHTAGKPARCQLCGKQSRSPAWQSWGTGCSPRLSCTATHLLVGDRQARSLRSSWQERQSEGCSCFVSSQDKDGRKGQCRGSQASHVHVVCPRCPTRAGGGAWEPPRGALKQVPEGHSMKCTAPVFGPAEPRNGTSRKFALLWAECLL